MRAALRMLAGVIPVLSACRDLQGPPSQAADHKPYAQIPVAVNLTTAPEVAQVRLRVTAADLPSDLWFTLAIQDSVATGTASVPAGPQRTFTLQALDSAQTVRYEGSATVDVVTGANQPLRIVMLPVQPPGQIPIVGQIGGNYAVVVTPGVDTVVLGGTVRLSATVRDSLGNPVASAAPTWQSLDTTVATVDTTGQVRARALGTTTITARYANASGSATIVVKAVPPIPVATISVTPAAVNLTVGATSQLTVTLLDAAGTKLIGRAVTWSTNNAAVATVSDSGLVRAVAAGTATVTATSEGVTSNSVSVTVTTPAIPVAAVSVTPTSVNLNVGGTSQLTAGVLDASGNTLTGRTVTWSTSNAAITTVSDSGLVRAVAPGNATVRAASEGVTSNAVSVTVAATVTSPGTVTDLKASASGPSSVTLTFTQVTDGAGQAAKYDVRFSVAPISWGAASSVANGTCTTPVAGTAIGAKLTCTVLGLSPATAYNFQLVAFRGTLNVDAKFGGLSNVAAATTPGTTSSATHLSLTTQPSANAVSGVAFPVQPVIQLRDASNNAVSQSGVVVSATLASGSGTLNGTTTMTTNASGAASFTNLAITGSGAYTLSFGATGLTGVISSSIAVTASSGGGGGSQSEPAYSPITDKLIVRDNFDSYTGTTTGSFPFTARYPVYRALGMTDNDLPLGSVVFLVGGRSGVGQSLRITYGNPAVGGSGPGGGSDIIVGPETRLGAVGSWDGTLPEKAGPYSHFFFSTWVRFSAGADPAGYDDSGVKGIMLWHTANQRYQHSPHRLEDYNGGRYNETRWDAGPPHPPNTITGLDHWKTTNGEAPFFSQYADGNWHRSTMEVYAGDPSGHIGERWWLDGVLVFDNMDNVGDLHWGTDYTYTAPISHWMVFGNYARASWANQSPAFTVDFDDWIAWTK